mmetsp:Transcript_19003/g.37299  ORF Transcript_19003/g.37299 Transcript_19003/m.37299 type:complete len:1110 (-) Transcript_19003:255-3584(-)|eukprot:CAMPEP_0171492904 /NCGR_PEP_ID=MMETSP0958-20121227/4671_1 /TAXON_ID=87120 /ORGANISM="Aurantiochytrium limacinum, Strain ATCCMYA-1381" /LENGTH=1109 /DNA_ID=CAMNT_0012026479 /DNA_START=533 /DNA_END=3862 /DNA_ORIENTATION=-
MRPAGAGRSYGFWQLLCDGGTLQLIAGSLALLCLVFDYGWAEPAAPNPWDPLVPGIVLREAITTVAMLYVFMTVPAAVVFWRFVSVGTLTRALQLCLGCLLLLLVYFSNGTSDNFYTEPNWRGAFWATAQHMLIFSVLFSALGYVFSFPFEEHGCLLVVSRLFIRERRTAAPVGENVRGGTALGARARGASQGLQEPLLQIDSSHQQDIEELGVSLSRQENILQQEEQLDQSNRQLDLDHLSSGGGLQFQEHDIDQHTLSSSDEDVVRVERRPVRTRSLRSTSFVDVTSAFCRASHAPFVFGCTAYILALAVCSFSLILSFYSFEPNTQCVSALSSGWNFQRSLLLEAPVSSSYFLGSELQLELGSEAGDKGRTTILVRDRLSPGNTIWKNVQGEPFLLAGSGEMTSWSITNVFYLSDTTLSLSRTQTIERVRSLDNHESVEISGMLHVGLDLILPYSVTFSAPRVHSRSTSATDDLPAQVASFNIKIKINYGKHTQASPRVYLVYSRGTDEKLFGFGTQLSYTNFDRACIPISVSEKGFGRGLQPFTFFMNRFNEETGGSWQHVHTAIPSYVSSHGRAVTLQHNTMTVFDLVQPDRIAVEVFAPFHNSSFVSIEASVAAVLKPEMRNWPAAIMEENRLNLFQHAISNPLQLPDWAGKGLILTVSGGHQVLSETLKTYNASGIKVAGVLLRDWAGLVDTELGHSSSLDWTADELRYPNMSQYIENLRETYPGLRVLGYFSPYVASEMHHEHQVAVNASRNTTFAEALHRNCLVLDETSQKPVLQARDLDSDFRYGLIQLFRPECQTWYEGVLADAGANFDGWLADHGEGYPLAKSEISFRVDLDHAEAHVRYAEKWLETSQAASRKLPGGDTLILSRTATLDSLPFVQLHTTGEQLVSWDSHDGLASALKGIITSGISGLPATSSYIGGVFRTWDSFGLMRFSRTPELLIRWLELAVFASPCLLTHVGLNLSSRAIPPALQLHHLSNWTQVRDLVNLQLKLWPLKQRLLFDAQLTGTPMARAMWLEFPDDISTHALDRQFMLGSELLVCPVLSANVNGTLCYLPKSNDRWRLYNSTIEIDPQQRGTKFWCEAPLGRPCLLERLGDEALI